MTIPHKLQDSRRGLLLYAATLACEVPAVWARTYIAFALVWFYSETQDLSPSLRWPIATLAGWGPLAWSLIALAVPAVSGWWWRQREGGRAPSERERRAFEDALADLKPPPGQKLPVPRSWFVLDEDDPGAAVCADTLMLTRGMIDHPSLPAVLAHELGHLATLDGPLTAALNRLVLWTPRDRPYQRRGAIRALFAAIAWLIRGGLGLRILGPAWAAWWRKREYKADDYAASLGKAAQLALFLDTHALLNDRPVPFMWLSEHTHPPTEHRIERLHKHAKRAKTTAEERVPSPSDPGEDLTAVAEAREPVKPATTTPQTTEAP